MLLLLETRSLQRFIIGLILPRTGNGMATMWQREVGRASIAILGKNKNIKIQSFNLHLCLSSLKDKNGPISGHTPFSQLLINQKNIFSPSIKKKTKKQKNKKNFCVLIKYGKYLLFIFLFFFIKYNYLQIKNINPQISSQTSKSEFELQHIHLCMSVYNGFIISFIY